jgi:hypothetical protein
VCGDHHVVFQSEFVRHRSGKGEVASRRLGAIPDPSWDLADELVDAPRQSHDLGDHRVTCERSQKISIELGDTSDTAERAGDKY